MLLALRCDQPGFKTVEFSPGLNIILADRTREATSRDSRNGLGKSTLVEILHFCLGGTPAVPLTLEPLRGWVFTLELSVAGRRVAVSREVGSRRVVRVEAETEGWPTQPDEDGTLRVEDWNDLLGVLMFGLPLRSREEQYAPKFRSLISYFMRRGKDAYSTPFEHYRKQAEWDKQVHNAFLLGLSWEVAADVQKVRDDKEILKQLAKASAAGLIQEVLGGSLGTLEAERVRLNSMAQVEELSLASFQVHPLYRQIEADANTLTREMQAVSDARVRDSRLLDLYERHEGLEQAPTLQEVVALYEEAGAALAESVRRRLEEVEDFHRAVVENRRSYLSTEVSRLQGKITQADERIAALGTQRAALLQVLHSHGALDEFSRMQEIHQRTVARLADVQRRLADLRSLEEGQSALRIRREQLHQQAIHDYQERRPQWEPAIALFNRYSEAMYQRPGRLIINPLATGYKFDVEIERAGSQGIGNMKLFCYDLTIARLRADAGLPAPGFLFHDSLVFDGVDERQRSAAIMLAAQEASTGAFQYVCTMNSDQIPWADLPKSFPFDSFVRLRLTDATPNGGLLGIRF